MKYAIRIDLKDGWKIFDGQHYLYLSKDLMCRKEPEPLTSDEVIWCLQNIEPSEHMTAPRIITIQ